MLINLLHHQQGRTEVGWRPGQTTSLAPPGSKYIVLKKVLAILLGLFCAPMIRRQGHCAPLPLPRYVPDLQGYLPYRFQLFNICKFY